MTRFMFFIKCPLAECRWHTGTHDVDHTIDGGRAIEELKEHIIDAHWWSPAETNKLMLDSERLRLSTEMWKE